MKILHLSLKAKWYEMIERGEKREEYREIKPYWIKRLGVEGRLIGFKHYDAVKFSFGYTKRTMIFQVLDITRGIGNPDWGAPNNEVIIIKLGRKINVL